MLQIIEYTVTPEHLLSAGKFVQIQLGDKAYLLFASKDLHQFHNQLVAHFLSDRDLPHQWQSEAELRTQVPNLVIQGGGRFSVNDRDQQLKLWDHSTAYGRFKEAGLAEAIRNAQHRWRDYSVEIA